MREGEGTWLGHVLEHVAIELQNIAGEEVTFGKTRSAGAPGVYTVVYEYAQRDEGIAAGELALRLLCSLLPEQLRPADSVPEGWNWPEARDEFIRFAQRRALGPSTASLVRAAEQRDIPWLRLNDQSLVQLGHGKYQQRIQATVTGRTPHIAVELASDKEETNKILAGLGLPVPQQELVQSEREAVRAARRIGFPVVTKPYNGNHGRGISIRLTTDEEVAQGFLRRQGALALGDRRDLPRRRRPPPAGRQRRAGRRHAQHAGARRRRRRAHGDRARRDREPGSAPRRRPREGADAAGARRAGAEDARPRRHSRQNRCRRRTRSSTCARPPTCPPAAPPPTSPTSSTPTTARWPSARCAPSGSTSAASTSSPRTSPRATAPSAAASARSTPRPASACTWRRARARRATSRVR